MPDERGLETDAEARARVRQVVSTQIFGDTPTDPTIGDVVVPAHDEEDATASTAAVDAAADDGNDEADDLAPGEAKRQLEATPTAEDFAAAEADDADGRFADDGGPASDEPSREDKIRQIEAATSVEEVDRLAEGDSRVTVTRAADAKRAELS